MPELGDFDIETFHLLVLVSLESTRVKSGLRLVAATPLRTKDVEAREEQLELFCTKIDGWILVRIDGIRIVGGSAYACKLFQFIDNVSIAKA